MEEGEVLKYLVIGAGGTGGCLGAWLQKSGQDVTWIARGRHLEKMKEAGLRLHTAGLGDFCLKPVQAFSMEEYLASRPTDEPDVVFVCVKYYSLQESIPFLQKICQPHTVVIPLLNVFGTGAQLQEKLPDNDVADGCIYIYGKIEEAICAGNRGSRWLEVYFLCPRSSGVLGEEWIYKEKCLQNPVDRDFG